MSLSDVQVVSQTIHPDGSPAVNLAFVIAVAKRIEGAGLVKGPNGGENVAVYHDSIVRTNRISLLDGTLVKVLSDSGPGGTNGLAWNVGEVDLSLFIPLQEAQEGPPAPFPAPIPPQVDLEPILQSIEALKAANQAQDADLQQAFQLLGAAVQLINSRIEKLEAPKVINTNRVWGHSHVVEVK